MILMLVMTLASYTRVVHVARMQRRAVRRTHHGQLPNLHPGAALTGRLDVSTVTIPVATVVRPASGEALPCLLYTSDAADDM